MKATKIADLRKLTADELRAKLGETREELMKMRFQQITGQLTDTSRLRIMKRDVARMETILNALEQTALEGTA